MASSTVAVVGGLFVDLILVTNRLSEEGETRPANSYHKALGGKGANAAIASRRACHNKASYEDGTIRVSNSDISFVEELEKNGVESSGRRVAPGKTTSLSFVIVEEDSGNTRLLCYAGATNVWTPQDFVSVESFGSNSKPDLVVAVMEINTPTAGIDLLLNASPASTIRTQCYQYLTYLLMNESEVAILSGIDFEEVNKDSWSNTTKDFLKLGVKNVVITLGKAGAYDPFTGAYDTKRIRQKRADKPWDIAKAVECACMASALTIGKMGAQGGIPWANEIENFAGEHQTKRATASIAALNVSGAKK